MNYWLQELVVLVSAVGLLCLLIWLFFSGHAGGALSRRARFLKIRKAELERKLGQTPLDLEIKALEADVARLETKLEQNR